MSIIRITKEFRYEGAHALLGYDGKCRHIHGHSYILYVTVSEVYVEKNFEPLPIELNHSLSGGTLSITPQTGSLSLSGRQLLMDGLSAADVSLKVDLPELVPGESVELPVVPSVPEGTTVLQQTPQTVTVTYNGEEN